jgi:hypothetical protein
MARNHQVAARLFFCIALLLSLMLATCSEDPAEPVNNPPHSPRNPLPADSTTADVDTILHWEATDPEGDPLTFDVYFGATDPPPAVSNNQSEKMYDPGTLEYGEKYLWKIVSKDDHGHETAGPLWMFTTGANQAPSEPINPDPANDAVDQPISPQLGWDDCTDPEGDPIQYDIYLDVVSPVMAKVDSNLSASTWNVGPLDYGTKYYWRVVARDDYGNSTTSVEWNFTTGNNQPPTQPVNLLPANGAVDQDRSLLLNWTASTDPESDPVTYDIYFGNSSPPPSVETSYAQTSYNPGMLDYGETYYWQIVARDRYGNATPGDEWHFTVEPNEGPTQPSGAVPQSGTSGHPITTDISWSPSIDPEGDDIIYDVYFGTTSPPTFRISQTQTTYDPGSLAYNQIYYWRIVARDSYGNYTQGSIWNFTTVQNFGPSMPANPDPGNGEDNAPITSMLSWSASTDPEGETVRYDVLFGTISPPTNQVATNIMSPSYNPGRLELETEYFWRVRARDTYGNASLGPIWSFTTTYGVWHSVNIGRTDSLWGVWGSSANDIYATGLHGLILHSTDGGNNWSQVSSGTEASLIRIQGSSADNIFIVGIGPPSWNTLLHYNGTYWYGMNPGYDNTSEGLSNNYNWGLFVVSACNVYATDFYFSTLIHYDCSSSTWDIIMRDTEYPYYYLVAVWGTSASNLYALDGINDKVLHSTNGVDWTEQSTGTSTVLRDMWGTSSSNIYVIGGSITLNPHTSVIAHYNGTSWTEESLPVTDKGLFYIWGSAADDIFVTGEDGTILHYDGSDWTQMDSGLTDIGLRGVWGSSNSNVFVVGEYGTILKYGPYHQ